MQLSASLFHVPAFARVPDLLRVWRPAIHANLRHESAAIRLHSLRIVLFGVKQGLEYPAECIEKVVALLVDPAEDVPFFPCSVAQIRRLALSLLDFINTHFHAVFLPRVAPAWIATASRAASLPGPSGWCFYGLYSLLSRSATSSLRECREVLDAILEFAFGLNSGAKDAAKDAAKDGAKGGDIASLAFLTRCLSCAPYGCWEEVLHVITSVNLRVYLSINQSEAFDILQTQAGDLDHTARSGGRPGELRGATLRRDRGAVEMRGWGEGKVPVDSGGREIRGMLCADYSLDSHAGSQKALKGSLPYLKHGRCDG